MKTCFTGLATLLVFAVFFSSCQREVDPNIPNTPQNDSALSRVVLLDTTRVPGQDTIAIVRFSYDAQKRMLTEEYKEIDHSAGITYLTSYHYKYNGTDTMPSSVTEKYGFSTDSIISYYSYNNGFIVKDSSVSYSGGVADFIDVMYFSALPANRFLRRTVFYDPSSGTPQFWDSTIYSRQFINGNLLSGLDSMWFNLGMPMLNSVTSMQLSFDNKTNPFAPFTTWYLGYFDNVNHNIHIDFGRNNLLSSREDVLYPVTSSEFYSYMYQYNASGLPKVLVVNTTGTDGNKGYYYYTAP